MKTVFLDRDSFPKNITFQYPNSMDEIVEYPNTQTDEVAERIQGASIVLVNKVPITKEAIENADDLQLIQVTATGINNIDLQACEDNGIVVQNVEGYSSVSVPEHTFSLLLALRRNLTSYVADVRAGKWASSEFFCFLDYPIKDLAHSTMVICGNGVIGTEVAKIAHGFSMKVIFAERKGASTVRKGYMDFHEAIKLADVITLHCPLTDTTKNLIDKDEIDLLKPDCLLLNMGRGGLVNEQALIYALEKRKIAGAGFDVATCEPLPLDHPLHALTQLPNFLLTPHIGWGSHEAMQKLADIAGKKMADFVESL